MRTLHVGLRLADLDRSLAFYEALGHEVVGEVPETGLGHLTMLKLPGTSPSPSRSPTIPAAPQPTPPTPA